MKLTEFFNSAIVTLPKGGYDPLKTTFDQYLRSLFNQYIALVNEIHDADYAEICGQIENARAEVAQNAMHIVEAAKLYLQGFPSSAYAEIQSSLLNAHFDSLITTVSSVAASQPIVDYSPYYESTLHPELYRMRPDQTLNDVGALSRADIFHVPYEKRHLVKNQRYSIAGLPCLYLGGSAWVCWEELERPPLSNCVFSKFHFAHSTKILDFQLTPIQAWNMYENRKKPITAPRPPSIEEFVQRFDDNFITSYIFFWPLIAACSIRVEYKEGAFFPHYIVPQLLLQWVATLQKVKGIRYFSTRTDRDDYYVNANYVFPASKIQPYGHCPLLCELFRLSAPVHWELLDLCDDASIHQYILGGAGNQFGRVVLADSLTVDYRNTRFHQMERLLSVYERAAVDTPL